MRPMTLPLSDESLMLQTTYAIIFSVCVTDKPLTGGPVGEGWMTAK